MKRFTCPICYQSDIVKENDFFVCQICRTKYSAEEVRKAFEQTDNNSEASLNTIISHEDSVKEERVIIRSVSATNVISEWKRNYVRNSFILALLPLLIPIMTILSVLLHGYTFEYTFEYITEELDGFTALIFWGCVALAVILFFMAIGADNKADEKSKSARITAKKENITVTNLKIYGSTGMHEFSIPCSEIKNTYIERTNGKSSTKITQEDVLCIVCENEILRFEFFENNSEISDAIKTLIPYNTACEAIYSIKVLDYSYYRSAMKALVTITLMDYPYAQKFLKSLPQMLVENVSKEKAENYSRILEENEVKFEIFES